MWSPQRALWQSALQRSGCVSEFLGPSSHCSPACTTESPHCGGITREEAEEKNREETEEREEWEETEERDVETEERDVETEEWNVETEEWDVETEERDDETDAADDREDDDTRLHWLEHVRSPSML